MPKPSFEEFFSLCTANTTLQKLPISNRKGYEDYLRRVYEESSSEVTHSLMEDMRKAREQKLAGKTIYR